MVMHSQDFYDAIHGYPEDRKYRDTKSMAQMTSCLWLIATYSSH